MSTRLRRSAVALLATTLAAGALGVAPAANAVGTGTISGTVTGSGGPIEDADVSIYEYNAVYEEWDYSGDWAYTDADGHYEISLPEGQYRIGFADYSGEHVEEYYDNASDVDSPDADTVTVSASTPVVADADLAPAAHITGVVTATGGTTPLEGIDVIAWREVVEDAGTPDEYVDYYFGGYASTDELGAYDVGGLQGGTYRIEFTDDDYFAGADYATEYYDDQVSLYGDATEDLVVAAQTTVGDIDAELALDSEITGVVTDANGDPIEDAEVDVLTKVGQRWEYVGYGFTDVNGSYEVDGLAAGTYRVRFSTDMGETYTYEYWKNVGRLQNATDVPVGVNATVPGIDAQLVAGEHDGEETPVFTNTVLPTVSGNPVVGQALTASTGTWTPTPTEFYYDWYRDGEWIEDAVGSTYVPTSADLGKTISVAVYAGTEGSDYDFGYAESLPTAPVTAAPVTPPVVTPPVVTPPVVTPPVVTPPVVVPPAPVVDLPTALGEALADLEISGKPKVGKTIKVTGFDMDLRTARAAVTYTFQWYAGTKKIAKATKSKLKVTSAMKGKKLSVKVTGTAGSTSKSVKIKVGKVS